MATLELTTENFDEVLAKNPIVFLDFWASWCGPCRNFAPTYEAASVAHPDIVFGKIDTEAQQELAGSFQIRSIPTIAVIREGVMCFASRVRCRPVRSIRSSKACAALIWTRCVPKSPRSRTASRLASKPAEAVQDVLTVHPLAALRRPAGGSLP